MDSELMSYRLRTARQKRRLLKSDRDKQLLGLVREEKALRTARRNLPLIPLEEPYQRGWKRSFVVREDVKRSAKGDFFEALLAKINTVEFSSTKTFLAKGRRKHRKSRIKTREVRKQYLQEISSWDWHSNRHKLTDAERRYFEPAERWDSKHRVRYHVFLFTEPWRYTLQIRPNIITHRKQLDEALEQKIAAIENCIERRHLRPHISSLKGDSYRWWVVGWQVNHREASPVKNRPLHALLGDCLEDSVDDDRSR